MWIGQRNDGGPDGDPDGPFLDGQMLVAMPSMRDERFARAVIYLCAHSSEGAMGIIVNQPASHISFTDLLVQLDVVPQEERIHLPVSAGGVAVLKGGPVETGRGFVLHTSDFFIQDSTLPIDSGICLTATLDILKAIAAGTGPSRWIAALGYAGWQGGQLEQEMRRHGWFVTPGDTSLLYDRDVETRWAAAFNAAGVDPRLLTAEFGTA